MVKSQFFFFISCMSLLTWMYQYNSSMSFELIMAMIIITVIRKKEMYSLRKSLLRRCDPGPIAIRWVMTHSIQEKETKKIGSQTISLSTAAAACAPSESFQSYVFSFTLVNYRIILPPWFVKMWPGLTPILTQVCMARTWLPRTSCTWTRLAGWTWPTGWWRTAGTHPSVPAPLTQMETNCWRISGIRWSLPMRFEKQEYCQRLRAKLRVLWQTSGSTRESLWMSQLSSTAFLQVSTITSWQKLF